MPDCVEGFFNVFSDKSGTIARRVRFYVGQYSVKGVFRGAVASEAKLLWGQKVIGLQECPESVVNDSFKRLTKNFQQAYGTVVLG